MCGNRRYLTVAAAAGPLVGTLWANQGCAEWKAWSEGRQSQPTAWAAGKLRHMKMSLLQAPGAPAHHHSAFLRPTQHVQITFTSAFVCCQCHRVKISLTHATTALAHPCLAFPQPAWCIRIICLLPTSGSACCLHGYSTAHSLPPMVAIPTPFTRLIFLFSEEHGTYNNLIDFYIDSSIFLI